MTIKGSHVAIFKTKPNPNLTAEKVVETKIGSLLCFRKGRSFQKV